MIFRALRTSRQQHVCVMYVLVFAFLLVVAIITVPVVITRNRKTDPLQTSTHSPALPIETSMTSMHRTTGQIQSQTSADASTGSTSAFDTVTDVSTTTTEGSPFVEVPLIPIIVGGNHRAVRQTAGVFSKLQSKSDSDRSALISGDPCNGQQRKFLPFTSKCPTPTR